MRIKFVLLILLVSTFAFGQRFDAEQLKNLYSDIPSEVLDSRVLDGHKLIIENSSGKIIHLGFELFENNKDDLVYCFLERKILEFYTAKDFQTLNQAIALCKGELKFNGQKYDQTSGWDIKTGLNVIFKHTHFDLKKDSLYYIAIWQDNSDNYFGMKFPNNYQTLTGKDKPELDGQLIDDLNLAPTEEYLISLPDISETKRKNDIYIWKLSDFIIPDISNSIYFQRDNNNLIPIYNPDHFMESFNNLFYQASANTKRVVLDIEHHLYGKNKSKYSINLSKLFNYAKINNLQVYVGIENISKDKIESTIILHQKEYNYIHLFYIEADKLEVFSTSGGKIKGILFSYIPIDNVKTLFGDYKQGNKDFIKKIK